MRSAARFLLLFVLALALAPFASPRAALASDPEAECQCEGGYGVCQHFLNAPWEATADPCWCDRCREFSQHDGKTVPEGWNAVCFTNARTDCYLRRHLVAWHAACSECAKKPECVCKTTHPGNCPACEGVDDPIGNDFFGKPWRAGAAEKLAKESAHFKKPDEVTVIYNNHFYLATDIGGVKVKMRGGSFRLFDRHEYAHLLIERAEYARREFNRHFEERNTLRQPIQMFFPDKPRDAQRIQSAYLGSPKTNLLYGGDPMIFCKNGQEYQPDEMLHVGMRHMIGHCLISSFVVGGGDTRMCPKWMFEGAAHWLSRLQDRFKDEAVWCGEESTPLTASGKGWENDVAKLAASPKMIGIEELFGKTSIGQFSIDDQKRAWSYFDVCLREWREPFVRMIADLRQQKEVRDAFFNNMQLTPEMFDERWRERVTGRRRSMSPDVRDDAAVADADTPSARERRALRGETDPAALAGKIRSLGTIADPRTVEVVLDLAAKNSELVRETVSITLLKMTEPECLERIWQYGLQHNNGIVRAYAARLCGRMQLKFSLEKLKKMIQDDTNWLARAEACLAVGAMHKDAYEAMGIIRKLVTDDPSEKARLAAMDALAMYGEEAYNSVPAVLTQLKSSQWQLRLASAEALAEFGSMDAVEDLVTRMEAETGRIQDVVYEALKKITRDDLGRKPENWRAWWTREKEKAPGGKPRRPGPKGPVTGEVKKIANEYAKEPQKYYGIELYSSRIGFVLDTSLSMDSLFDPDPKAVAQLSRQYSGATKLQICKEEISQGLKTLDPRAHFSLIVFNTSIRFFKKNPIPASPGNIASADGWLRSLPPAGETNYYGGLRAALDLDEGPDELADFRSTPDTLTFLTDGMPTKGEIVDPDTILEWYTSLNRYARIKTHVIAFGSKGLDLVLLEGMAKRNDGVFVHVPEKGE